MSGALARTARLAAFAGAHLAVGLALAAGIMGSVDAYLAGQRERIAQAATTLDRLALQKARAIGEAQAVDPAAARESFIVAGSESLLDAELLRRLRESLEREGIELKSLSLLPSREWQGLRFSGAELRLAGSNEAVARFVSAVESGSPFLLVAGARLAPAGSPADGLEATLEIYGATRWQDG